MLLKYVGNIGRNRVILSDSSQLEVEYNKEINIPEAQVKFALDSGLFIQVKVEKANKKVK